MLGFAVADGPYALLGGLVAIVGAVVLGRRGALPPSTCDLLGALVGGGVAVVALHLPTTHAARPGVAEAAGLWALTVGVGIVRAPGRTGRVARRSAIGFACVLLVASALALVQVFRSRGAFSGGVDEAQRAVDLVRANHASAATAAFESSGAQFARAERVVRSPVAAPGRWVPGLGLQLRALADAGRTGHDLAGSGARIVSANNLEGLRLHDGTLPMAQIRSLEPGLVDATTALDKGLARLRAIRSPWLLGPIDKRLDAAQAKVERAKIDGDHALIAARILPPMLGSDGPRRYFLALVTPAEARGSGGLVGNFAELTADGTKVKMPRQGRDSELGNAAERRPPTLEGEADFLGHYGEFRPLITWANVTMSPDFPTTTRVISKLYPQLGGEPVDGVIMIDPAGIAALLQVVGPIEVARWPEPLTSANVEKVLLTDQYVRYTDLEARRQLLDEITRAAFDRFSNAAFTSPKALVDAMAPAAAGRHLMIGSTHASEMDGLRRLGLAGAMPPVQGDALSVVTQNGSGNKIDTYLHREIHYTVAPDPRTGHVKATATITLHNEAPSSGLPAYIIGNALEPPLPAGTSQLYVSVYSPWDLVEGRVDGVKQVYEIHDELGRRSYSRFVQVPPGGTVTLSVDLQGSGSFAGGYHLDLFHTTQVNPDRVQVDVTLPPGMSATARSGGRRIAPGRPVLTDADTEVDLAIRGSGR